jgi:hypothetical protein
MKVGELIFELNKLPHGTEIVTTLEGIPYKAEVLFKHYEKCWENTRDKEGCLKPIQYEGVMLCII